MGANPPSVAAFDLSEDPPMFKFLSPSLLAIALGFCAMGSLNAATAAERDQHAIALGK